MAAASRPGVVALVSGTHVLVTALVWRDIARHSPGDLRGSPTLWRFLTAANTGNSLLYLLVGRRRPT